MSHLASFLCIRLAERIVRLDGSTKRRVIWKNLTKKASLAVMMSGKHFRIAARSRYARFEISSGCNLMPLELAFQQADIRLEHHEKLDFIVTFEE